MNFNRKKINNQQERLFLKSGAGFTLIETLVATGIMLALLAVVLANYRRGNDDSALNREVSLLMSNVRLAQEQTAAGQILKYCEHYVGHTCKFNGDCPSSSDCAGNPVCLCNNYGNSDETPKGGFGVLFGCRQTGYTFPWIEKGANNPDNPNGYFIYGDNRKCVATAPYICFPPDFVSLNTSGLTNFDGRVSTQKLTNGFKGDTLQNGLIINEKIKIKDIRLSNSSASYYCAGAGNLKYSPWRNQTPPGTNSLVPSTYPLQIFVRFLPPGGRALAISDNVGGAFPPVPGTDTPDLNNPWLKADIMFGLKNRDTDCKVITITKDGAINQSVDSNCSFTN